MRSTAAWLMMMAASGGMETLGSSLEGIKKNSPRHNDPDVAQRYRDERKAKKIRSMIARGEAVSEQSQQWLVEWEARQ